MRILIVIPRYLPGYKSGGPQRTVQNICDVYATSNDIYIVTQNVDFGESTPYDVDTNVWLKRYGVNIMYVEPENYKKKLFNELYKQFDIIYACGLFCQCTIDLLLINKQNDHKKLYVAPMGVFSKNALAIRGVKKSVFLKMFSALGLFRKITWSFTSEEERKEAIDAISERNIKQYIIAEDLPRHVDFDVMKKNLETHDMPLRIIFLSRIVPKKNLLYAIEILKGITEGAVVFDIYGFKEDQSYWEKCENAIKELPRNITCKYAGSINAEESVNVFSQYDIFLFPTQGENFGHVVYESLAAGCLPVISDTTPWKDFDVKQCGSVIKLDDIDGFRNAIQTYLDTSSESFLEMKMNAIDYAEQKYKTSVETSGYKAIFNTPDAIMGGSAFTDNYLDN